MIDTTDPSYWLNWTFFLCALFILVSITLASFLIWKYEGAKKFKDERREYHRLPVGVLYEDELWGTCLKGLHPGWLLLFRIFAFVILLGLLIGNFIVKGLGIFYYYTQWTFTLATIFFGLASAFSIRAHRQHLDHKGADHFKGVSENGDAEQGSCVSSRPGSRENTPLLNGLCNNEEVNVRRIAGPMGYACQITYQVAAGAAVLTDIVFWLVIYPFITSKDYKLAFFDVCLHSVNILVLGDTILNSMPFPVFRIAYFILWTAVFVIFQWIFHMCVSLPWPYPFMDLATPYSFIWYLVVGLLHIPCYGSFALISKLKHLSLSRYFPESYQCSR